MAKDILYSLFIADCLDLPISKLHLVLNIFSFEYNASPDRSGITVPWKPGFHPYQPSSSGIASINEVTLLLSRWNVELVLKRIKYEPFHIKQTWAHSNKTRHGHNT